MLEPDLLVKREGRFHRARIMSVLREGPFIEISFVAETAEWFAPDESGADLDGWLRGLSDIAGSGEIGCQDEQMMQAWQQAFERWRDDDDLVEIELSFDEQAINHHNPRTGELIRVEQGAGQDDPGWRNQPL